MVTSVTSCCWSRLVTGVGPWEEGDEEDDDDGERRVVEPPESEMRSVRARPST